MSLSGDLPPPTDPRQKTNPADAKPANNEAQKPQFGILAFENLAQFYQAQPQDLKEHTVAEQKPAPTNELLQSTREISAGVLQKLKENNPIFPISQSLDKITKQIASFDTTDPDPLMSKVILDNCKTLAKSAKPVIDAANQRLQDIKEERLALQKSMASENTAKLRLLNTEQKGLQDQLSAIYKSLTAIRKTLTENPEKAEIFGEAQAFISKALGQKEVSHEAAVVIPVPGIGKKKTFAIVMQDPHSRAKIGGAIKNVGAAFAGKVMKFPFRATAESKGENMALAANKLMAAGRAYALALFGADMVSACRNVASEQNIMEGKDIEMSNQLRTKIINSNLRIPGENNPIEIEEKTTHVADGVCAGTSLAALLGHLNEENTHFADITSRFVRGVDPTAHANQTCYEHMGVGYNTDILNNAINHQLRYALDERKGIGIYKANFQTVMNNYSAIVEAREFPSDFGRAIAKVIRENPELRSQWSYQGQVHRYITDTAKFKNAVLKELGEKNLTAQQMNELNWLIGVNELYTSYWVPAQVIEEGSARTKAGKITSDEGDLWKFFSDPDIGKSLTFIARNELDFSKLQAVVRSRGRELEVVGQHMGFSYGMRNDSETLDRAAELPEGHYMVSIVLDGLMHAMCYYKGKDTVGKDVEYLFDPNFGTIDCSGGRLKEQFTRLLTFDRYPADKKSEQGVYSEGNSHAIEFLRVVESPLNPQGRPLYTDVLAGL